MNTGFCVIEPERNGLNVWECIFGERRAWLALSLVAHTAVAKNAFERERRVSLEIDFRN